ncbi:Inherit from NOG: ATPase family, AAA domain containing 5 [Seminavis robusta]|uniref:Inherit from NOG: ATPase family, AAA domain containing 5 n=1 Tax=Seminavis robusta TaxID=568900 RepID=A0A9N8H5M2_9STRA|nr:Inherit from NOG: ATPase family, AAA domain containing 5 [Seminavis robusta]|eukprot:Sro26_g017760.1 Inherit from NOG: ATPase family, AAA domain containing 5 (1344) ;mRNA; f:118989-123185
MNGTSSTGKKKRLVWVCDNCKEFKHEDCDIVTRHEEQCKGPFCPTAMENPSADDGKKNEQEELKETEKPSASTTTCTDDTGGDNDSTGSKRKRINSSAEKEENLETNQATINSRTMTRKLRSSSARSTNSSTTTTEESTDDENRGKKSTGKNNSNGKKRERSDKSKQRSTSGKDNDDTTAEDLKKKRQKKPAKLASIFNPASSGDTATINNTTRSRNGTKNTNKNSTINNKKVLKENNGKDLKKKPTNKKNALELLSQSSSSENSNQSTKRKPPANKEKTKTTQNSKSASSSTVAASKKQKTTNTKNSNASLAAIFQSQRTKGDKPMDEKALMAEQRAVEFQAKMTKRREMEREQQRKREELFFSKKKPAAGGVTVAATRTTASRMYPCPRFPVPSFVFPSQQQDKTTNNDNDQSTSKKTVSKEMLQQAQLALQKAMHCLHSKTEEAESSSPWEWTYSLPSAATMTADDFDAELAKILASAGAPGVSKASGQSSLWAETYYSLVNLDDICGQQNQLVANDLVAFVRDWMVHRQDAHERMAERQRALQKKRRATKKKKSTKYADDEDLWSDSDNEDGLARLCLIDGPVGTCKSALVHAVARHCGCQIIELNTSDKRGSADLRKALEEATRSHSSLAMLKKQQTNFFAKQELVDSDDENDDDANSDCDSDGEVQPKKKGTSLTMILIDEADITFETGGDSAFWSALNDLARKAQCPIFLTSNRVPRELDSMLYKYVATSRPSPTECAKELKRFLTEESILPKEVNVDVLNGLALLAELCDCDLRRILHRLQLFCSAKSKVTTRDEQSTPASTTIERDSTQDQAVNIVKVSPRQISSETETLLTIRGKNFCRLKSHATKQPEVQVFVGEQLCPVAKIVDDKTILAVCPALVRDANVDKYGLRSVSKYVKHQSLGSCYSPVSLHSLHPSGSGHVASSHVFSHTLVDGTTVSALIPYNVEWLFPEEEDESDVEFDDAYHQHAARPSCLLKRKAVASTDTDKAHRMLEAALEEWGPDAVDEVSTKAASAKGFGNTDIAIQSQCELDSLAKDLELASDASLLDDFCGLPFLSGATPGFGYQFTPEGSESNFSSTSLKLHGNSTHCSEERLLFSGYKDTAAFYGDSDAWMSNPTSARDRELIRTSLGARFADAASTSASAVQQEDEEDVDDLTLWSPPCSTDVDEDAFLLRPIPAPLQFLPALLLETQQSAVCRHVRGSVFLQRRVEESSSAQLDAINVVCTHDAHVRMRYKGLHDANLSLDYIPILRMMAVFERAILSIEDNEPANMPRRRTRRSNKGRSHYLESLNKIITWGEEGVPSASEAGERLAKSFLQYQYGTTGTLSVSSDFGL